MSSLQHIHHLLDFHLYYRLPREVFFYFTSVEDRDAATKWASAGNSLQQQASLPGTAEQSADRIKTDVRLISYAGFRLYYIVLPDLNNKQTNTL